MSTISDDLNPLKQKVPVLHFGKQTDRPDILKGTLSANDNRFNKCHESVITEKSRSVVNMQKTSTRMARSSAG